MPCTDGGFAWKLRWWFHHKELDAARQREEENSKKAAELKRAALAKLTTAEKIALGLG